MSFRRLILQNSRLLSLRKQSIAFTSFNRNYEGDGKTVATNIADQVGQYIIVSSFNENGFKLSNGGFALGSLILFPNVFLSWQVKQFADINQESLTVFKVAEPKPEVLIIGTGESGQQSIPEIRELKKNINALGLNVELLPTRKAISMYNFMLADFRVVAGAFLLPKSETQNRPLPLAGNTNAMIQDK